MFCDLIEILLRIEFRTKGRNALRDFFFVLRTARYAVLYPCNLFDYLANKDALPTFCPVRLCFAAPLTVKASEWGLALKTASSRASRLHSDGMNAEIKATKSRFDERTDFSSRIASLPFIRNHGFARNDTKGAVFRAFPAFLKPFHEMPKKKTVNLSIENAVLCLTFAFREQICIHGWRLFFDYSEGDVGGWKVKTNDFIKCIGLPLHHKTFCFIRHGTLPYEINHFCFRCLHHPKQQIFLMILPHRFCRIIWLRYNTKLVCFNHRY